MSALATHQQLSDRHGLEVAVHAAQLQMRGAAPALRRRLAAVVADAQAQLRAAR